MSAWHDRVEDLTLFEALTGGVFCRQNWQNSGIDQYIRLNPYQDQQLVDIFLTQILPTLKSVQTSLFMVISW